MDEQKVVLVLENSNSVLESKSDSTGAVILEGVFAQFGVVNNNDRLYEENEYLPHLEYLKTKINSRRLMGELDHPDKFDISLQKVSHIIESLEYDNSSRTVRGRVRLLDTDPGRQAKKLIEAGVPLSISSRAAGVVGSDKRVKLKKIFTYDLVADPGFENATLSLVNESLGFSKNSNVRIYDVSEMYDSGTPFLSSENQAIQTQNKKATMDQNQKTGMISEKDFNEYSKHVKKEIGLLEKKIELLTKKSLGSENTIAKLSEYSNYLAQKLNGAIKYSNYLSENLDRTISDSKKTNRGMQDIKEYANYLAERFNISIEYQNYLAENLDQSISFSNYLSKKINQTIDYSNYIAENFDNAIDFTNYLAENLNNSIQYQEYLGENLDNAIRHNDYLAENLNSNIGYSNYLAEQLDKSIGYGDYIAESINVKENKKSKKIMEKRASMISGQNLSEKVDYMINEAKKEKASVLNESSKFPFLRYLSPEKRSKFVALKQTEKEIVSEALSKAIVFSEKDVVNVWESALAADRQRKNLPVWISEMPKEYAPIWESMSDEGRKKIAAAAQYIKLETPYQIRNFWASRPEIANFNGSSIQTLNESANPYAVMESVNNVNSEYRDLVRKALKGKI